MNIRGKQILNWKPEIVDRGCYKDLGHYVIDMGEIDRKTFADTGGIRNVKNKGRT